MPAKPVIAVPDAEVTTGQERT